MASRDDILRLRIDVEGKDAQQVLDRFAKKVQGTATKTTKETKKMAFGFKEFKSELLGVGVAIGSVVAAGYLLDRFFKQAEKIRSVSDGFHTLTARVDESADAFLGGMRRASKGFVSDFELMKQANNALILGLPVTAEAMEELTDIAVKLGRALGKDAAFSIESIVTGIGRQSRQMLDNLGIVVSVEEANRRYAQTLNKAVGDLTRAEVMQGFLNEALRKARPLVGDLTTGVETLSDAWSRTTAAMRNHYNDLATLANKHDAGSFTKAFPLLSVQLMALQQGSDTLDEAIMGAAGGGAMGVPPGRGENPFGTIEEITARYKKKLAGVTAEYERQREILNSPEYKDALKKQIQDAIDLRRALVLASDQYTRLTTLSTDTPFESDATNPFMDALGRPTRDSLVDESGPFMIPGMGELRDGLNVAEDVEAYSESMLSVQEANANTSIGFDLMATAMHAAADAMWNMTQTGEFSARSLVNSIAQQTFGVLSAIAIESVVRGIMENAAGFAAMARYDLTAANNHWTSSSLYFATAAKAGVGAGAALAIGAASRSGGGGGPSGGGAADRSQGIRSPAAANAPFIQEVHIFLEGQGFIQDPDSFARYLSERIKEQGSRAGA